MTGDVVQCPQCGGAGYVKRGKRCTMCRGLGKVEDGGKAVIDGIGIAATSYIGTSGKYMVLNLPESTAEGGDE